ncbi:MAG: glycosyltransferase family 2 protein [Paracoccaceae bacterium]
MPDLIISLTTIPSRIDKIAPTLHDLLNQSADVQEIRLNIPRTYRRFDFTINDIPKMPKGIKVCIVDEDMGPATKVLPTVQAFRGQNVEILFCDDDQPYDSKWAQRFLNARKQTPNACIVENGYSFDINSATVECGVKNDLLPRAKLLHKGIGYRLFRLATLCTIKPGHYVKDGYIDILEGYRGAMIRPEFIPDEAFDIPDILWTVDDPWLSGQMKRIGVPIWLFADAPRWEKPYEAHLNDGLFKFVYKDHDRHDADAACIEYLSKTYGIWQDRAG